MVKGYLYPCLAILALGLSKRVDSKNSLTGFPAQSVGSSNTYVSDLPCLLVLITGMSQSRQHGNSESNSYYLSDLVINSFTGPKLISRYHKLDSYRIFYIGGGAECPYSILNNLGSLVSILVGILTLNTLSSPIMPQGLIFSKYGVSLGRSLRSGGSLGESIPT
ncbi:hypothetical protein Tco_0250766 [Tanacetum coccineum]